MKYLKILVILMLFAFSCKKPETASSVSLSCKINGKTWTPGNYVAGYGGSSDLSSSLTNSSYSLVGINGYQNLHLVINSAGRISAQNYLFNSDIINNHTNQSFATYDSDNGANNQYITSSKYTGYIQINNIDAANKTVSGTFAFMAYDSTTHDSINVTDGVFNGVSYGN